MKVAPAIVVATVFALLAMAGGALSLSAASAATAPDQGLVFLSEAEYSSGAVWTSAAGTASAVGVTPFIVPPTGGSGCTYWDILASTSDAGGRYVPTRCGDSTIAWKKACQTHNFCSLSLINKVIAGTGDLIDIASTRYTYQGHILGTVNGVYLDITLKVVTDRSTTTAKGKTPDGKVVGTITAYCVGVTVCPAVVNTF